MHVARCVLIFCALLPGLTAASAAQAQTASSPAAAGLNTQFLGRWVGTLEYRDFSSNAQVLLPTWLTMEAGPDGATVRLSYTYDDGPSKTVRESSKLRFDAAENKATVTSEDGSHETYDVAGLVPFTQSGRGVLLLTGKGQESGKPVDVRITLTLRRNLYTYRKETRLGKEEFKFRDGYTFTRAEAPPRT